MRKIEGLKVVRGFVLVALGVISVACSQTVADDSATGEATASTRQAVIPVTEENKPLFCIDCFEETNGGGPGTPNGNGSNGFVGGVAGYASGATGVVLKRPADNTPCDPGVECVNVFGDPRPLDESKIRVLIIGKEKSNRVEVDLPADRGFPSTICGGKCSEEEKNRLDKLRKCYAATFSRDAMKLFCGTLWGDGYKDEAIRCYAQAERALSTSALEALCKSLFSK